MSDRGGFIGDVASTGASVLLRAIAKAAKDGVKQKIIAPEIAYWRGIVGLGLGHRSSSSRRIFNF